MLTACDAVSNDVGRILITYFDLKTLSDFTPTLCVIGIPDRVFFDQTGVFRLTQFAGKITSGRSLQLPQFCEGREHDILCKNWLKEGVLNYDKSSNANRASVSTLASAATMLKPISMPKKIGSKRSKLVGIAKRAWSIKFWTSAPNCGLRSALWKGPPVRWKSMPMKSRKQKLEFKL